MHQKRYSTYKSRCCNIFSTITDLHAIVSLISLLHQKLNKLKTKAEKSNGTLSLVYKVVDGSISACCDATWHQCSKHTAQKSTASAMTEHTLATTMTI